MTSASVSKWDGKDKWRRNVFYFVLALCFSYYYLGEYRGITVIAYILCVLFFANIKHVTLIEVMAIAYVAIKTLHGFEQSGVLVEMLYFRLYWGFLVFYFFFKAVQLQIINGIYVVTAITILEYVLVQVYSGAIAVLPNYQVQDVLFDYYEISGITGGVNSFGGNRTVGGILLLALFIYADAIGYKWRNYILLASALCFSGLAWSLSLAYLIYKHSRYGWRILYVIVPVTVAYLVLTGGEGVFYRASGAYARDVIFDYKREQIEQASAMLNTDIWYLLFGRHEFTTESLEVAGYGLTFGDFLALEFLVNYGIVGLLMFILVVFQNINRHNVVIIATLLIGTLHYHVIFSLPGQFIFSYMLVKRATTLQKAL